MRYTINDFHKKTAPDNNLDLSKVESKVFLTREEIEKNLLDKTENGECVLKYDGRKREGIILSLSSSGKYVIGLLKIEE
jgi:hypothetical protein